LLDAGARLLVTGAGDAAHTEFFEALAARRPGQCGVRAALSEEETRAIYAGCDMLLLLRRREPCGFEHMAALRYGTLPIVYETGGFRDTVHESANGSGNGFTFDAFEPRDILDACLRARNAYRDEAVWDALARNAMQCDNSWATAAAKYMELYRRMTAFW
jgi:starch synthase